MRYDIHQGVINVKSKTLKFIIGAAALAFAAALALSTGGANAITGTYSLFGDAAYVSPGLVSPRAVELPSTCPGGYPDCITNDTFTFSGVSYGIPAGTTFASLDTLSTDFMPQAGDSCSGGAPRFSIGIDTDGDGDRDGSIFAYFGTDSASPACVAGSWQNTTDLLDAGKLLDTGQLPGGTFYDPYASALVRYGSMGVTSISAVVDAGWAQGDNEQTITIDNTNTDGTIYTYDQPTNKDECKKGGWMFDPAYKNQGDCVSYFATNGRNQPSGN